MLYFQVVILAATGMLVYYCEFTDTFSPAEQGFNCRDPTLTKPDPGPEQDSRVQPVILYSVVGGLPVVLVSLQCFMELGFVCCRCILFQYCYNACIMV